MKTEKTFNIILTIILIPLWLTSINEQVKQIGWLNTTINIIGLFLLAIMFVRFIYSWFKDKDIYYLWQRRKIDCKIRKVRKKLERIIANTNDPSVMEYAFDKLQEICPSGTYYRILTKLAENEQNMDKMKTIQIRANQIGERI